MISLLVAHSTNLVIGDKGGIPWHLTDDLKRFKSLTTGKSIIMGRKTYDSIGRVLPNRRNIVITRNSSFKAKGIEVANSLEQALELTKNESEVFIIGGGQIYKQAMPVADRIYATIVNRAIDGDTKFPRVNLQKWRLDDLEKHHDDSNDLDFHYATFTRRSKPADLYFIDEGRELEQILQMEELEQKKICVFCKQHFEKEHREPIEIETQHWIVARNDYPYKHTKLHLLYIPKSHVSLLSDLSPAALEDLPTVLLKIEHHYQLTSYGQFMRVGDFRYNGATIHHLHGHIIVADHNNPEFENVKVKLASRPKD